MTILTVNIKETPSKSYPIYIDNDDFKTLKTKLDDETKDRKRLVIFSEKVYKLYGKTLGFNKAGIFVLKDGEQEKNIKNYEKIIRKAIDLKLSRKDCIVAIGGGVVGDMAGFAAATYMRGIDFIQVPTTLLACVDSSVGGKTAIDMPGGKNFVGAFYQPKSVYINLNFLKTLNDKQYKSGFGEIIKYAFIEKSCAHSEYFNLLNLLKTNLANYQKREPEFLSEIIRICLELKSSVVEKDEKENNLRKILNLGHTFGHALEEVTSYKRFTHGFGVVLGLMYIFNYALENGMCSREYYDEAFTLMNIYGYEPPCFCFMNKKQVFKYMQTDKKSDGSSVTFIVPTTQVIEHKVDDIKTLKFGVKYNCGN